MIGFGLVGVVLIVFSIPLILGKVPPNHIYGRRTAETMSGSRENWYRQNRQAGKILLIIGCGTVATAVAMLLLGVPLLK
ncbi:SdpI family protein [Silvibacterium acidisoli]|uniref:SdpI family protein n=1 Tax=Acidobacteriaceae bacterium ZG23-2 TaxID=2883246 RepID=UPI00406D19E6